METGTSASMRDACDLGQICAVMWLDSACILKTKLVEFTDGLDVGMERKRGVKKNIFHLIKLCSCKRTKSGNQNKEKWYFHLEKKTYSKYK